VRSDITQDEPEADSYDLVHCRWLLMHLDEPAEALHRMARALRPGGWLLVEEVDGRSMAAIDDTHPLADGFNATTQKRLRAVHDRGIIDGYLGGLLPRLLAEAGLRDVTHEGIARIISGGSAWSTYLQETWRLIDGGFVAEGVLSAADVATSSQASVDPSFHYRDLTLDAVWGRRLD
jgi:SAM-dependent methyltransferase